MLKLYGGSRSRASIVQWYLEELDVPYEFVLLDMANGEHLQPDFRQINPMGKVPAIIDGDLKLWESGAILLYLGEKHGQIPSSLTEKSIIQQWVLFANSTLATGLFVKASREKETPQLLNPLNQLFSNQPYILGTDFTVADVAVGSVLAYAPTVLSIDLSPYPQVLEYIKRICGRPVWQKLFAKS